MISHDCAGIIGFYNNQLLFVRNEKSEIILAKGHIEQGETSEDAAIREFKEETGYSDFTIPLRKIYTLIYTREKDGDEHKFTIEIYVVKLNSLTSVEKETEDGKKLSNVWVDMDKAQEIVSHENLKPVIQKIIEYVGK